MKKQKNFLIVCFLLVMAVTLITSFFAYRFIKVREPVEQFAVVEEENQKTKIEKWETKDYYFYKVEDYERDLTYSWQFTKDDTKDISVEDSLYITKDLRLSLDAHTKDTEKIINRVDQKKLIISFDYHGELPLQTTVKINVSNRFQNGEHLYLYYYNPEDDTIEYIMRDVEVKNGYVEFQIDHCSDYFLTGAVVNDAINNPQNVNFIIIGLIIVVIVLVVITLIQSKK